ncbi:MAG TPA: N-methyl-L-tryptophan oxidase [Rhizomicrobium sp.]|nr:N-methyl-L-tryptophan oxidase [Rhizomicrobium sp.]
MQKFDVIVVGLGAMGSAALYQLAKRGVRVAGLDRYSPPHDQGSSHGGTRITRLAIGEGAHYTPLVKRSHEIWREIEKETGADLLTQSGELIISSAARKSSLHIEGFFQNTVDAARRHGIAHELLDANQIRRRFPLFDIRDDEHGFFEPEAGFLRPEACIGAQLLLAEKHGAAIHRNEAVMTFESTAAGVTVTTDRGRYAADRIIVAAGAWLPTLLGGPFERLLRVYRQVQHWFAVDGDVSQHTPEHFPVFIWELADWPQGIYGFPVIDGFGLKVATEQYAETTSPDAVARSVGDEEIALMRERIAVPNIKGLSGRSTRSAVCLYTVTPDAGFIIDRAPQSDRVILASCCSGHGFKHSPAIGEILADMAERRAPAFDLAPFRLARFG